MSNRVRFIIFLTFALLSSLSVFFAFKLRFSFDFEQFFPEGDPDLEFFQDFISHFEADDNFLLIGIRRDSGVFGKTFLEQFHELSLKSADLPHVLQVQSLTKFSYPVKTPFGITTIPAIHRSDSSRYAADRQRILKDERLVYNLIDAEAKTLVIYLKTASGLQLDPARELMQALDSLMGGFAFEQYHYLGRPYFQRELVKMQQREISISALISGLLVSLILLLIFRRFWGVTVAIVSIAMGMLLFIGFLGASGRPLNAMAALYPVLMIIVGTSDVIHIMSKYVDELKKGTPKQTAIWVTIKEIGMATFLTSATTAIGFATLLTSRVTPIRDFGINAAIGVMIAYLTVLFFTTGLLSYFDKDQIIRLQAKGNFWETQLDKINTFTKQKSGIIGWGSLLVLLICGWGISNITTNYNILTNMPRGEKITDDFHFFERYLTGFRPMDIAVFTKNGKRTDDLEVLREIDKVERYLHQYPFVQAIGSVTAVYKSIHQMNNSNRPDAYQLPESDTLLEQYRQLARKIPQLSLNVLQSEDKTMARITSRIQDIGADSIQGFGLRTDDWILENTDTSIVSFRRTGTGLIIDKNAAYIRESLLKGLGIAIFIIALLMALLFKNWKMMLVALVPNFIPLLAAGALLGFTGVELEAGVSIVFAVIFGIAVDDTIHFLSRYKLLISKGIDIESALATTFQETGKAIILTSIILFFGFLVMLFSIHPPSVTIGWLISLTLVSAIICDLLLIPWLIRWLYRQELKKEQDVL